MNSSTPPPMIGRYRIVERLGAGAFGIVYLCEDLQLQRRVAVKVLLAAAHASPELTERFQREARAVARLSHPNIVSIFDVGQHEGLPYLVMEYVDGPSLERAMAGKPWSISVSLNLAIQLADALVTTHSAGIVHRDVKPSNILIDNEGRPRLADFGLARIADDTHWLSHTGDIVGTPRYMSPEQVLLATSEIDYRTDIYSLGAVLYELLSGVPAVNAPTPMATLRRLTDEIVAPIDQHRSDLPAALVELLESMLNRDREQRPESMKDVVVRLRASLPLNSRGEFGQLEPIDIPNRILDSRNKQAASSATRVTSRRNLALLGLFSMAAFLTIASVRQMWNREREVELGKPTTTGPLPTLKTITRDELSVWKANFRERFSSLSSMRFIEDYRGSLATLVEESNQLVATHASDSELRSNRARLLMRNGEVQAAATDLENIPDGQKTEEDHFTQLMARGVWEILYCGLLPDVWLRPLKSNELTAAIERALHGPDTTHSFIAAWMKLNLDDSGLNEENVEQLLAKFDENANVKFNQHALIWQALTFHRLARRIHFRIQDADSTSITQIRNQRDAWDQRSAELIQRGLNVDAHDCYLLFLRTQRLGTLVEWETADGANWEDVVRRQNPVFETSYQQFRRVSARISPESSFARALLLASFVKEERSMEQLREYLGDRQLSVTARAFLAWLQLRNDPDGEFSAADAGALATSLEAEVLKAPKEFGIYVMLAICRAMAGRWQDARQDLLKGRIATGADNWDIIAGNYADWCQATEAPLAEFQERTIDVLWTYKGSWSALVELQKQLLTSLHPENGQLPSGLSEVRVRSMEAWGHFRLAKMQASAENRNEVLYHIRESLKRGDPSVGVDRFRTDATLAPWLHDEEFVRLFAEYEGQDRK